MKSVLKLQITQSVKVIQIGKAGSNYYSQYVTYHLSISDSENNRDRMSQFSSHIAMQYIMDVLYGCIYNEKRRKNTKEKQNTKEHSILKSIYYHFKEEFKCTTKSPIT